MSALLIVILVIAAIGAIWGFATSEGDKADKATNAVGGAIMGVEGAGCLLESIVILALPIVLIIMVIAAIINAF